MEYLLILYSFVFSAFLIYVYWVKSPKIYFWSRILGYSSGDNNDELAQKMMLQDINSTKNKSILVPLNA